MRNIAEVIEDDKNGKQLSQTERQIAVAYTQGKYDAVRELNIRNNSNANEVLDKIRAEIEDMAAPNYEFEGFYKCRSEVLQIIDKHKAESEGKE